MKNGRGADWTWVQTGRRCTLGLGADWTWVHTGDESRLDGIADGTWDVGSVYKLHIYECRLEMKVNWHRRRRLDDKDTTVFYNTVELG
jgi:hypothetical protein